MKRDSKNKLQVWIDDELSEKISDDCKILSYRNKSDFVRDKLNGNNVYVNFHKEIIFQMKKQGNNLNQIARHLNSFDGLTADDITYQMNFIKQKYTEILEEVRKLNDTKID